jgi:hypothetical protein
MAESQNFKELLLLLNDYLVDYLIVGGYAVMRHSEPRFTKDLDIWVGRSAINCELYDPHERVCLKASPHILWKTREVI